MGYGASAKRLRGVFRAHPGVAAMTWALVLIVLINPVQAEAHVLSAHATMADCFRAYDREIEAAKPYRPALRCVKGN